MSSYATPRSSLGALRTLALLATALSLGTAAGPASAAERTVPRSFVGAVADGALVDGSAPLDPELGSMTAAGVESIRVVFDWRSAQPYRTAADVPPDQASRYSTEDGVPTDWSLTDDMVARAAARRLTVLPVPLIAPEWSAQQKGQVISPPEDPADYARFVAALVRRYGPEGRFWTENPQLPRLPIRRWQIWNEPIFSEFWPKPWEAEYVALLRSARKAIKREDKGARIILAGLPNDAWNQLETIYDHGGRGQFDTVAIHPFTAQVAGVVTIAERTRATMRRHRDEGRGLMVTELSWTSARRRTAHTFGNETTEAGQAKKIAGAYRLLARERKRLRLQRVYWYTWMTLDRDRTYPFDYAGIVRLNGDRVERKPAYSALRRTALQLEGCRKKSASDASRCLR